MFDMATGIALGVLGIFLLSYAIFSSTQSWKHSLLHWICGLCGLIFLSQFWRHTLFYLGLQGIAMHVCGTPKTAGLRWNQLSKTLLQSLFTVQIHNETTYQKPVIFVMNHIAKARPFDEFCLALIDQPNLRIVALPRKPNSYPDIIMKSSNYLPVKHGQGYDSFLTDAKTALTAGQSLLIFPEGKHTEQQVHWTQLAEFQSGVFDLAVQTQIPIVPIILEGFNCPDGWIKGFGSGAQPLRLHYLDPVDPVELSLKTKLQTSSGLKIEEIDDDQQRSTKELSNQLKHLVRFRMNQKLKRIFLQSLPEDKAAVLSKVI